MSRVKLKNCRTRMCSKSPPIKNNEDYNSWYDSSDDEVEKAFIKACKDNDYYCKEEFECPICVDVKPFDDFLICPQCEGEVCKDCAKKISGTCPHCRSRDFPLTQEQLDMELIKATMANEGDIELVRFLLDHGANIHVFNDLALLSASTRGHLEIVRLLLANGANVHAQNDRALILASAMGRLEIVQLLLANGVNVHTQNDQALIEASTHGYFHVVRILLANGADVHAQNGRALIEAYQRGHLHIVGLLSR